MTGLLDKELRLLNIQSTKEFSYNRFSLYRRSKQDFAFSKQYDTWIRVGAIMQPDMYINFLQWSSRWISKNPQDYCH